MDLYLYAVITEVSVNLNQ